MDISMNELRDGLERRQYIADDALLIPLYLALRLEKPLLITGAAGVGKTELAKVVSAAFDLPLIRLQCYEGLDESRALYEWNYQKQLLHIEQTRADGVARDIFSEEYLLPRPLLKALIADKRPVLLIDEIDKTDAEFEAFLFEVLSDFQVSVPEWGTIRAKQIPIVILTSNGERELSDGLKRRSVYLYIDYPDVAREAAIVNTRLPQLGNDLTWQLARGVAYLRRELELKKNPSIAETLDWAESLLAFNVDRFTEKLIDDTMNLLLKDEEDFAEYRRKGGAGPLLRAMVK